MFLLLKRVQAWRAELLARGVYSLSETRELQDHVFEEARRLSADGMGDDAAFEEALRRLGPTAELDQEFRAEHAMAGNPGQGTLGRVLRWAMLLLRYLRHTVVFLLPGAVIAVPGFLVANQVITVTDDLIVAWGADKHGFYEMLSVLSRVIRHGPLFICLVGCAVIVLPTLFRARYLRDRHGIGWGDVLHEEWAQAQQLLIAGVLLYPLVAFVLLQLSFAPIFTVLRALGG